MPSSVRTAAFTSATTATHARPEIIPGTKPVRFRLSDSVTVTASFDRQSSFKKSWVAQLPQSDQDDLLAHEQGHYDLNALLSRDFFLAVMELKSKTYTTQHQLTTDISNLDTAILSKSKPAQERYDKITKAGADKTEQANWLAMIQTAFNTPVSPPQLTPDNIPIKVPILTALANGGIVL